MGILWEFKASLSFVKILVHLKFKNLWSNVILSFLLLWCKIFMLLFWCGFLVCPFCMFHNMHFCDYEKAMCLLLKGLVLIGFNLYAFLKINLQKNHGCMNLRLLNMYKIELEHQFEIAKNNWSYQLLYLF
jgi:hypothetical protein